MYKKLTMGIVFIGIVILVYARWFNSTNNKTLKKYMVINGTLMILSVVAYNAVIIFDLPALSLLAFISFVGAIVFLVKALLSKHRLNKLDNHQTNHPE